MKTIHLQGIGQHPATEAKNLKPGQVTVWNWGMTEKVVSVEPTKTGNSLNLVITGSDGKNYTRRVRQDRLIGIAIPDKTTAKKKK